jgi:hypothetical protein
MNEVLIMAFVNRIKAEEMTLEQIPIPYKEAVEEKLSDV